MRQKKVYAVPPSSAKVNQLHVWILGALGVLCIMAMFAPHAGWNTNTATTATGEPSVFLLFVIGLIIYACGSAMTAFAPTVLVLTLGHPGSGPQAAVATSTSPAASVTPSASSGPSDTPQPVPTPTVTVTAAPAVPKAPSKSRYVAAITASLNAFFQAINDGSYSRAWHLYSPHLRQKVSLANMSSADSTTQNSNVVIHSVRRLSSRLAVAFVTFTSTQDPAYGPNGDSADDWTLDYTLKLIDGRWLIDQAIGHGGGSTHTSG